jgi:nitrile hydratase accessory protein
VFAESWEAQAFALAVKLSEQGYFTWKEWAAELATELKAAGGSQRTRRRHTLLRALAGNPRAPGHK